MNNLARLGSLRTPPKPSAQTVNDALVLLTAFGGGDERVRMLLEEMWDVAQHNEALLAEGREILKRAEAALEREADLVRREADIKWRWDELKRIRAGVDAIEQGG